MTTTDTTADAVDHPGDCTGCAHPCPWQGHHWGAPYCGTCADHADAVDAGYPTPDPNPQEATTVPELPEPPTYNPAHSHGLDTIAGYDVIHATWPAMDPDPAERHQTTLTVTAVIRGATNYGTALQLAKAHRTGRAGSYGYPATRYVCGCREIADRMRITDPRHTPATFHDIAANA